MCYRMVRIHKKLLRAMQCLTYFTTHQWTFKANNSMALLQQMSPEDRSEFHFELKVSRRPVSLYFVTIFDTIFVTIIISSAC